MNLASLPHLLGLLVALSWFAVGCATRAPYQTPIPMQPITVGSDQEISTDRMILIFDASGSVNARDVFPADKAWVESFVQAMPDGQFESELLAFGGNRRRVTGPAPFDREALAAGANDLKPIGEGSPFPDVFENVGEQVSGKGGRSAIIFLSDGVPDRAKWGDPENPTLAAAKGVVDGSKGQVCFHTVLSGDDAEGAALLKSITTLTECGTFRTSADLSTAAGIEAFERAVFLSAKPKVQVTGPGDADGDGVLDPSDECPGTPRGAKVGKKGCWTLQGVNFATSSFEIPASAKAEIVSIAQVMKANPTLKIRVDGFTDSTGSAAYNARLSQQRADSVKAALVAEGVPTEQLSTQGNGPANPIGDNSTVAGRAENRRIEFTVL